MMGSPMISSPNMSNSSTPLNTVIVERKRPRITYTPQQINYLEAWYNTKNHFISTAERNQIAEALNVAPNQVIMR
jgi:hypothetical protein